MQEFVRSFDLKRGEELKLIASLTGFPGTFRVYGSDKGPNIERFHVEFRTADRDAALKFLENDLTMG